MRCIACNKNLTDFESTRKSAQNGDYLDFCNECAYYTAEDVATIDREDLRSEADCILEAEDEQDR
jgi:hypothetical protein|tara:strand:- start:6123 stop:6317 length:195 start_codon:yes stop_codon:yes gene_type:complete